MLFDACCLLVVCWLFVGCVLFDATCWWLVVGCFCSLLVTCCARQNARGACQHFRIERNGEQIRFSARNTSFFFLGIYNYFNKNTAV